MFANAAPNTEDDQNHDDPADVLTPSLVPLSTVVRLSRYWLFSSRLNPVTGPLFFLDLEIVFDALDALNLARKLFDSRSLFGRLDDAVQ
jgi:hypothetical protein